MCLLNSQYSGDMYFIRFVDFNVKKRRLVIKHKYWNMFDFSDQYWHFKILFLINICALWFNQNVQVYFIRSDKDDEGFLLARDRCTSMYVNIILYMYLLLMSMYVYTRCTMCGNMSSGLKCVCVCLCAVLVQEEDWEENV